MKKKVAAAAISAFMVSASILGTSTGVAHAAVGTNCSAWAMHGLTGVKSRVCLQSEATRDRAYIEVRNEGLFIRSIAPSVLLQDLFGAVLKSNVAPWNSIAPNQVKFFHTGWQSDSTMTPEFSNSDMQVSGGSEILQNVSENWW